MCISNQRECARFNPPLVCCALNLLAFVIVLFTVGAYITHYPVIQSICRSHLVGRGDFTTIFSSIVKLRDSGAVDFVNRRLCKISIC